VTKEHTAECPAHHLFRIRSNGKSPVVPHRYSAQAKSPDLPDFERSTYGIKPVPFRNQETFALARTPMMGHQASFPTE